MEPRALEKPRFRHEQLVAEPIEEQTGRFIDVMDPDSGNAFRFFEVEFSLACAMDGERDVAGIIKWAKEELGLTPSENEVRTVVATLGELGYLERPARPELAAPAVTRPDSARPKDENLAPGVVVGAKAANNVPAHVELGEAGSKPHVGPAMPSAPDIALGAAGTKTAPAPKLPADEVPLGQAGRTEPVRPQPVAQVSDVSIDLADQMPIGRNDVKEAVRQSKVMSAVDVPKDLLDALEDKPVSRPPAEAPRAQTPPVGRPLSPLPAQQPPPAVARTVTPVPVETKPVAPPAPEPRIEVKPVAPEVKPVAPPPEVKPPVEVKPVEVKPPVELPKKPPVEKPVVAEKQPVAPPAPQRGVSPVLIILLILVLLGGGAFLVWKYVLDTSNEPKTEAKPKPAAEQPKPPEKPPEKPAPPPIKLSAEPGTPVEVKAALAAAVETVVPAKDVKKGDPLVTFAGAAGPNQALANAKAEEKRVAGQVEKLQKDLDAAKASNNAAAAKTAEEQIADRTKSLDEKRAALAKAQAEVDKYVIKAPVDGAYEPSVKANDKPAADAVLAKITPPTMLVATFPAATGVAAGDWASVTAGEKKLVCKVVAVDNGAKVACPNDSALADAVVTFGGKTEPPEVDMAAGSGSGSAGSGSAAPAPEKKPPGGDAVPLKQFPKDQPKAPEKPADPAKPAEPAGSAG